MTTDADKNFIGYAFTDVARLLRTVFERRVRDLGLTLPQWIVMTRVHAEPGLSQSEVADILEIEKATAGRLIDKMEAKQWLERRPDAQDRRVNRLHLTAEANRLHDLIFPIARGTVDDALAGLTPAERATLEVLMTSVRSELLGLLAADTPPRSVLPRAPVPAPAE
ncbi:MAG: MarR family transcriptional regulator [Pseudomonadota bacterium]